jgi:hypothetical protein
MYNDSVFSSLTITNFKKILKLNLFLSNVLRLLSTIAIFAEALLQRRILLVSLGGFSGLAFGGSQRLNS